MVAVGPDALPPGQVHVAAAPEDSRTVASVVLCETSTRYAVSCDVVRRVTGAPVPVPPPAPMAAVLRLTVRVREVTTVLWPTGCRRTSTDTVPVAGVVSETRSLAVVVPSTTIEMS